MPSVACIYMGKSRKPGACEIYRGNQPLYYLEQQSEDWRVQWLFFSDLWENYLKSGADIFIDLISRNDLFVFPRIFIADEKMKGALAILFSMLRKAGKRIIYETDDDYTNQDRHVVPGDAITPASWADAITVTTPYLGKTMQRLTKRPYYVLPNCVDPTVWADGDAIYQPDLEGNVVVGLTGSSTHKHDWYVLKNVIPALLDRFPTMHFVLMGFHPEYLKGLPNTSYVNAASYIPYSHIVRSCDIILAPVNDDLFNLGKSPIKAVEGMAAQRRLPNGRYGGAAVIATDNPIYRLAVKHEKTGLLTPHTEDGWQSAIELLLSDTEYRLKLQENAHRHAYKKFDASKQWKLWDKAYRKVLRSPQNPISLPVPA